MGAIFQATSAAIQKKVLGSKETKSLIAAVTYTSAGLLLGVLFFLKTGKFWPDYQLSEKFWQGMFGYIFLNVIAIYFLYKALSISEFNHLMPFIALTSLTMIIPPIFILGEVPSLVSLGGIIFIVAGAILMNVSENYLRNIKNRFLWKGKVLEASNEEKERIKSNRKGVLYFLVTATCYTLAPTATKVAILESSALFVTYLALLAIGAVYVLIYAFGNSNGLASFKIKLYFLIMIAAGVSIAIENFSINTALNSASVANVFTIKRTMPFFAFLIGLYFFKEKAGIKRKILATLLMVVGAIVITIFK